MNNPYYSPESLGLTPIGEFELSGIMAAYRWWLDA